MVKGQSALEYMMTYGWAILIIVIVAVILYSMGIFNPRTSVTASSSGFSPFAVSAAVCNSSSLNVAFTTGGLPNGATSVKLEGLYLSSMSGVADIASPTTTQLEQPYTSTSFSAESVASGEAFTVYTTSVGCSTSGTPFTASGALEYKYTTAAGPVTTNATGTIAGTSS
jgi:hypothetical protein